MFRFGSLRSRLYLLVLLALVPASALMVYVSVDRQRTAQRRAESSLLRLAQLTADAQQQRIASTRDILATIARMPEVQGSDPVACQARLVSLVPLYPQYVGLGLFGLDGATWCTGRPPIDPSINVSDRLYFQQAISTRDFAVGEYQIGRRIGRPVLGFGYPIFSPEDELRGVLYTGMELTTLNQHASQTPLPPEAVLTIVDRNGIIMVRDPGGAEWIGQPLPETDLAQAIQSGMLGVIETAGVDGVRRLYAFTPIEGVPNAELFLTVGLPLEVVYAEANQLLVRNLLWASGVAGLVLVITGLWSTLFILRPVQALEQATQRLAAGDLSSRIRPGLLREAGELGRLGEAFDNMADQLQRRFAHLQSVYQVADAVARAQDLQQVYTAALNGLLVALRADRASILLTDSGGTMRFRAWRGLSEHYRRQTEGHSPWRPDTIDPLPITVADVESESGLGPLRATILGEGIRALGFFPLLYHDQLLGKFMVYYNTPHVFEPEEVQLAQTLASHIALAVERAQGEAALREQTQTLETLHRLGQVLSAELDPTKLAQAVTEAATGLTGAEFGAFFYSVLDEDGTHFKLSALSGLPETALASRPEQAPLIEALFPDARLWRASDARQPLCEERAAQVFRLPAGHPPVASCLAVPMLSRSGDVLGGLFLGQSAPAAFDERAERLMLGLAAQAAIALDNARLYADAQALNAQLEERVQARTAELQAANAALLNEIGERKRAETELAESHGQLRHLSARLQAAREEERARIAREIHDELGQQLTGLKMDLVRLRRLVAEQNNDGLLDRVATLPALVDSTIQTVRRIASELRPSLLDDFGLAAAIDWQLQEFQGRSGIRCRLTSTIDQISLSPEAVTAVFRVFQETLTNVARHAEATEVEVTLEELDDHFVLQVHDNGRGITPAEIIGSTSLGLLGMRERVQLVAGQLSIQGQPGQGTTVVVKVPLMHALAEQAEASDSTMTESPAGS